MEFFWELNTALISCYSKVERRRANRRRTEVPMVTPPDPLLSGGRSGAGEGGDPGIRRAGVYRVVSFSFYA